MNNSTLLISFFFSMSMLTLLPSCGSGACDKSDVCCGTSSHQATTVTLAEAAPGVIVINVLDKKYYDDCHIKGSISVPMDQLDSFIENLGRAYPAKDVEVVVYCANYTCSASGAAAKIIANKGFKVLAYEAGMAEWRSAGLPVEGACKESYLTKTVAAPTEPHGDVVVISTQELAKKLAAISQQEEVVK
jgi:rhodanese-related sulfurtransferase